jgi:hypothetical protein
LTFGAISVLILADQNLWNRWSGERPIRTHNSDTGRAQALAPFLFSEYPWKQLFHSERQFSYPRFPFEVIGRCYARVPRLGNGFQTVEKLAKKVKTTSGRRKAETTSRRSKFAGIRTGCSKRADKGASAHAPSRVLGYF